MLLLAAAVPLALSILPTATVSDGPYASAPGAVVSFDARPTCNHRACVVIGENITCAQNTGTNCVPDQNRPRPGAECDQTTC
ncbi:MAG: hypothetical protein ACRD6R_09790 [Candidatus Polarisedimenticolia bacterium]